MSVSGAYVPLANIEVLEFLRSRRDVRKALLEAKAVPLRRGAIQAPAIQSRERRWLHHAVTKYLENTSCKDQTRDQVVTALKALTALPPTSHGGVPGRAYNGLGGALRPEEALQLVNMRASTVEEVYLVVEDCELRFGEEGTQNVIDTICAALESTPSEPGVE